MTQAKIGDSFHMFCAEPEKEDILPCVESKVVDMKTVEQPSANYVFNNCSISNFAHGNCTINNSSPFESSLTSNMTSASNETNYSSLNVNKKRKNETLILTLSKKLFSKSV